MSRNTKSNAERNELVDLEGLVLAETEKAYRIAVDNSDNEQWFPKSQLESVSIRGDEITCEIPRWLAEERKII